MKWKTFKNYIPVLIGLALGGLFVIWVSQCGERREVAPIIKDDKTKEAKYKEEIKGLEEIEKRLLETVKNQDEKIAKSQKEYKEAEKERLKWKGKYEEIKKPVDPGTLKTLEDCKLKYTALTLDLSTCGEQVQKTEDSLLACHSLNLDNTEQIGDLQALYANKSIESEARQRRIDEQRATIDALKRIKQKFIGITAGFVTLYSGSQFRVGVGACIGVNLSGILKL